MGGEGGEGDCDGVWGVGGIVGEAGTGESGVMGWAVLHRIVFVGFGEAGQGTNFSREFGEMIECLRAGSIEKGASAGDVFGRNLG